jgi:aspartate-semialdehyde dehydrogenase
MASKRSVGKEIIFNDKSYLVEELCDEAFDQDIDIALFSAGGDTSERFSPVAAAKGVIVIDNSSAFRMDPLVPLVVPEVNPEDLDWHKNIIANPNCSTIQAVVALKPLYDAFGIERIVYSTYQAVSGSGVNGYADLERGIKGEANSFYPHPIAYNVLPHIDVFLDNGYTKEEMKMITETQKILHDDSLRITATTVRVPVYYSHSESVNVELKKPFELSAIRQLYSTALGIVLQDDPSNNVYPLARTAENTDAVYVGRLRRDYSIENGLNLWVVADNIRKGAASNAVQIAFELINRGLI